MILAARLRSHFPAHIVLETDLAETATEGDKGRRVVSLMRMRRCVCNGLRAGPLHCGNLGLQTHEQAELA